MAAADSGIDMEAGMVGRVSRAVHRNAGERLHRSCVSRAAGLV